MKVLVTGGAGFIGSHLSERLLDDGADVVVLDDLSTGSEANLGDVADRSGFRFREGSVRDVGLVEELLDGCDVAVHLAAAVGVRLIVERPVHTIETNVRGTEVVLQAAARDGTPVMIASSSEVYGKRKDVPFSEGDDLILGPTTHSRWSYACSKALDEWLALAYAREKSLPVTIVRLFNTVGPRQTGRYGMVLPTFAAQAVAGEPITVYGTGQQSRCFIHVRDAVDGMVRLLATEDARGEVFNVGSDREVTIERLAEMVRSEAESSSPVVKVPYEDAYAEGFEDMMRRVPDVAKIERTVGFRRSHTLEDIVAEVVAEQRARRAAGV